FGAPEWTIGSQTSYAAWTAAHVYPDGSVLAAGFRVRPITPPCPCPYSEELLLRRFHADGSIDTSFGDGGGVTTDTGSGDYGESLAVADDGTIVLGGTTGNSQMFLAAR